MRTSHEPHTTYAARRAALAGDASLPYLLAVGFGLGLGCAALSWHLLEQPLQRWKDLGRARVALKGARLRIEEALA